MGKVKCMHVMVKYQIIRHKTWYWNIEVIIASTFIKILKNLPQ